MPLALLTRLRKAVRISRPFANSKDSKFVVIVAGEASADLHGSNLVKAMVRLNPNIVFWGIGGQRLEQAGVKTLFSSSDMAVVGVTEVIGKLYTIVKALRKLKSILKNDRPDLLILIDYPDFNINIAKTAKRFQIPVLYYISPQIWAWRRGRVKKLLRRIDRMAVILPFEEEFFRKSGMEVEYVGHPLLDACPGELDKVKAKVQLGLEHDYPVVGLLPGSREQEIRNLLPVMIKSAEILGRSYPNIRCLLPLARTVEPEFVQTFIENSAVSVKVIKGDIYHALGVCDVALVASGTVTLETAIMGIPMVIIYRVSPISFWVGKIVIKVPCIGLVNLVAEEKVVPELIQDEVTPDRLAHEAMSILEHEDIRANMIMKLKDVKESLGRRGASERTTKIALEMMR